MRTDQIRQRSVRPVFSIVVASLLLASGSIALGATIVLEPVRDNSMFQNDGDLSSGAGEELFSGLTGSQGPRRALLDFDVAASVPAGSTINSASLQLVVIQAGPGSNPADVYTLHRLTTGWGEGASDAAGSGMGAAAQAPDATWTYAEFDTVPWSVVGGDFLAPPSASAAMPTVGGVLFVSPQLGADVADMLGTPSGDHGWILIGAETASNSARSIYSRETFAGSFRPKLTIDFTPPAPQSVTLEPVRDTSLYEQSGDVSNGAGPELFSGRTDFFVPYGLRRILMAFDVAGAIPPGSTILSASLSLNVNRSGPASSDSQLSTLHRVTADWGEGSSGAGSSGNGTGSPAESGADATWTDRFYEVSSWLTPGGDFVAGASASFETPRIGALTVPSNASLVADVADWLANPSGNHGWVLRGDEDPGANRTARRWDSRESGNVSDRPALTIEYLPGTGGGSRGGIPDGDDLPGTPLTLAKLGGDDVRLAWASSCRADDTDYGVYEGEIGVWYGHGPLVCSTAGALTHSETIASSRAYFLVVPNDGTDEGSYGDDRTNTERPTATSACLPQDIGAPVCP